MRPPSAALFVESANDVCERTKSATEGIRIHVEFIG
jgi:hypothetical protein